MSDVNSEMMAELEKLRAENEALKAKQPHAPGITFKVSDPKKCLSVYGLMVRPVTLYASQWERLLDSADKLRAFIAANNDKLARKA